MSGDFSRNSFDNSKAFSLVRLQQGRLLSDADFNEQGDILRAARRQAVVDIIGPAGFPQGDSGFALSTSETLPGLLLSRGSAYVGGEHIVCPGSRQLRVSKKSGSGTNTVWVVKDGPALAVGDILCKDQKGGGPTFRVTESMAGEDGSAEFKLNPSLTPQTITEMWLLDVVREEGGTLPTEEGRYLAFLEVWDAAVSSVDDAELLEVAFDGPDTSTRDTTRWKVGFLSEDELVERGIGDAPLTCADVHGGLDLSGNRALLAARATISSTVSGPCTLPPESGYRSVENHLYRVEVHIAPGLSEPRYKWSRDNGMHRTRYSSIEDGALIVESTGRDEVTRLKGDDWIEIRDADAIANNQPGFFARIDLVSGNRVTLAEIRRDTDLAAMVSSGQPNLNVLPTEAIVQRWEGGLPKTFGPFSRWEELELGVEVSFRSGTLLHGDHWTIPARALTGDVDWPLHEVTNEPLYETPEGLNRSYAPLGFVKLGGESDWDIDSDCRELFAPLVDQVEFEFAGGDGQQAMPNETSPSTRVELPQQLLASVTRGGLPISGVPVKFKVTAGNGRLAGTATSIIRTTGSDGLARVNWAIDPVTELQTVEAHRLDSDNAELDAPVIYTASLSRARGTSFDPSRTPELAGAFNVQDAIELLAQIQHGGCETHVITPATDWIAVLQSIPAGADVNICFAPGVYQTKDTAILAKLGNVRLNGSGKGVVLRATGSECALEISNCESVQVRGLTFEALALPTAIPKKTQFDHRLGALTVTGTAFVDIAECDFACGPDHESSRTCLTIRARKEGDSMVPLAKVRVHNCNVAVGFKQEGILVHDVIDSVVEDNRLTVLPIPNGFKAGDVSVSKSRRDQLINSLISNVAKGETVLGKDVREVRAGELSYTFMSAVPQAEWDRLVKSDPPPPEASKDGDTLAEYFGKLADKVVKQPELLKTYEAGLKAFGGPEEVDLGTRRKMLTLAEMGVSKRVEKLAAGRNVLIERDGQTVAFKSPVGDSEWERIVKAAEAKHPPKKGADLSVYVRNVGAALLDGNLSRQGFTAFNNWFRANIKQPDPTAHQAIVCAGRQLDTVRVAGNTIRGFNTAVRIAVSHEKESFVIGDAVIEDNACELATPGNDIAWLHGIYVGNVDRLMVRNNRLMHLKKPNHHNTQFEFGIWVFGYLGKQLLFKENRIEIAPIGFRIKKLLEDGGPMEKWEKRNYHWLLADNQVVRGRVLDLTSPSDIVIRRDNSV